MTRSMAIKGVPDTLVDLGEYLRSIHWDRNFDAAPLGVRKRIMMCDQSHHAFSLGAERLAYWAEGRVFLVVVEYVDQFLATHPNCQEPTQNKLKDHLTELLKPLKRFGPKVAPSDSAKPPHKRHHDKKGPKLRRPSLARSY